MIKAGANTNICNIDQSNLLMKVQWYAPHQQIKHRIVRLLVEGGCEVNMQNDSGETALFAAIQNQDTETMKFLLQAGSNPNQNSLYNKTPLSYAASEASLLEVNLLLEAGADPNIGHPLTAVAHPETLVYLQDKQEIVKQLITAGANINTVDPEYGTVLVIASFIGSQNLVMTALNAKAKINLAKIYPTHIEAESNSHTLSMLLAAGESCSEVFTQDEYPLVFNFVTSLQNDQKLKNHCRKTIRDHFIKKCNKMNLFLLIPRLPLPALLKSYLLYDMF